MNGLETHTFHESLVFQQFSSGELDHIPSKITMMFIYLECFLSFASKSGRWLFLQINLYNTLQTTFDCETSLYGMHYCLCSFYKLIENIEKAKEIQILRRVLFYEINEVLLFINRLKASASDLSRNKPSIKPEAAGRAKDK